MEKFNIKQVSRDEIRWKEVDGEDVHVEEVWEEVGVEERNLDTVSIQEVRVENVTQNEASSTRLGLAEEHQDFKIMSSHR